MKYIVQVIYHPADAADVAMYINEGKYDVLGETDRMGNATFYATEDVALNIAHRYAKIIREEGGGIKATLKVLVVLTQTTDSVITTH